MNPLARRRFAKRVKKLDYPAAANLLQALAHAGYDDPRVLEILAAHTFSVCEDDASAEIIRKYWTAYNQGRLIKFTTGKVISADGIDVSLIDAVDEVFEEEQGEER